MAALAQLSLGEGEGELPRSVRGERELGEAFL
jgi:hypothetical protein